jgi:hypothetical protein
VFCSEENARKCEEMDVKSGDGVRTEDERLDGQKPSEFERIDEYVPIKAICRIVACLNTVKAVAGASIC